MVKESVSYAQLEAAVRELHGIQTIYPAEDLMDEETEAAFLRDLDIIATYKRQHPTHEDEQTLEAQQPPKERTKMPRAKRSKYEDSCIFLYILAQLYQREALPVRLEKWQQVAQQYKNAYEAQIRRPGDKLITLGKRVVASLISNDSGTLQEIYRETECLPHPEAHRRVLRATRAIYQRVTELQARHTR